MTQKATFAAGCFWGVEELFRKCEGVISTRVGYTGGETTHPTYENVCSGRSGHAEAVEIVFDPGKISYEELLDVFWKNHNPTTPNRQEPDIGSQYRSAIFYHTEEQRADAEQSKIKHSGVFPRPIVTQIVPASQFWPAEEYHQQYFAKRGGGSCHI